MKKLNLAFLGAIMIALVLFTTTGCKKDKDKDDTTTVKSKPNDQQGSTEADNAISDVNDFINNKVGGGSNQTKVSAYNLPCGVVSVDSSTTSGGYKVYKFNYGSQTPCGYKKKSGEISFVMTNGTAFNDVGCIFKITFTNYVVEVLATGSIVTLNGSVTITNTTGGYIWAPVVNSSATVNHKVRGTFTVKYSDGTERDRSYFQSRTWASTGGWPGLSLTIAGDTTISGVVYYELGRTYEHNYEYRTEMVTNYVWSNCGSTWAGPYVLKTGHAKLHVINQIINPAYFEVEGGYYWDYSNVTSTPTLVNDCTTNCYKITTVLGTSSTTSYQLY